MAFEITKFETIDGKTFEKREDAEKYELFLLEINKLLRLINADSKHDTIDFKNGKGFFQLTSEEVKCFIDGFGLLIKKYHQDLFGVYNKNPKGIIGRYLCDMESPLYRAWQYLACIDSDNRRWGQPYFALHPDEGESIWLNRNI